MSVSSGRNFQGQSSGVPGKTSSGGSLPGPVQGPNPAPAPPLGPPPANLSSAPKICGSTAPIDQVLTRKHLYEMTKEIDANLQLDDDVEEFLLNYADEYMDKITEGACKLAAHRKSPQLESKDVQTYLERSCNMWAPGTLTTDELLRVYKRNPVTESHKQRVALIKKTIKKY